MKKLSQDELATLLESEAVYRKLAHSKHADVYIEILKLIPNEAISIPFAMWKGRTHPHQLLKQMCLPKGAFEYRKFTTRKTNDGWIINRVK